MQNRNLRPPLKIFRRLLWMAPKAVGITCIFLNFTNPSKEVKFWLWGKVLQPYRKGMTVPEIYYVLVRTLKVSVLFYSMHFEDMTAIFLLQNWWNCIKTQQEWKLDQTPRTNCHLSCVIKNRMANFKPVATHTHTSKLCQLFSPI